MNLETANFLSTHGTLRTDASFKDITTIKIGGKIDYLVSPFDLERLLIILRYLKEEDIPFKIVGCGSNLVCGDGDYEGCVIRLNKLDDYTIDNNILDVSAGVRVPSISRVTASLSKSGLEFACGIPGSVGGALYMNAGAYRSSMGNIVEAVHVLDIVSEKDFWLSKDECAYAYRSSIFQKEKDWIVLGAKLNLVDGNREKILALNAERLKRRLSTQPLDKPSAGSCFRNPEGDFSWRLIDGAGLRGYQLNGIKISEKHSNFIINAGNATANDFIALTELIKLKVKEKYGVDMHREVEIFHC